jgi:RNA-directed DNA polymerase
LEDKIVQRAVVEVMNAIYEGDFLGFSYGFRSGRSAHQALDILSVGLMTRKVSWVLDADILNFFGTLDWGWLVRCFERRIGDRRIVRLIQKWLKAGVLEEGKWTGSEVGTVQGGSISPLLANIYIHYVFDLWVYHWRKTRAEGNVIVVRYADDFIVGFQYRREAERFLADLHERFVRFGLELHQDKTRVLEFGRFAQDDRSRRKEGKPGTFNFLGFTHICGLTRKGKFTVLRKTMRTRRQAKLKERPDHVSGCHLCCGGPGKDHPLHAAHRLGHESISRKATYPTRRWHHGRRRRGGNKRSYHLQTPSAPGERTAMANAVGYWYFGSNAK